jgi:uncharacterized membrane protein
MRGRLLHRLRRGAVAPMAALLMTSLLGFTGLAVDVGRLHLERRALQAAVDAAALSAAREPSAAQGLAGSAMTRQGYGGAQRTVVSGTYTDDPGLSVAGRFAAGGTTPNAVRVTAQTQLPMALSRVLTGQANTTVTATATAAHRPLAAFSVGAQTLGLDGGLLNQLLSALLGGSVNLDVVSYRGLANAQVGLLEFLDLLATRVGLNAGNYTDLLNSSVGLGALLDVAADVLNSSSASAATALEVLSQASAAGRSLVLGDLLSLAFNQSTPVGQYGADQSYTNLDLNALNLVQSAIQLGGNQAVSLPVGINIPGLATVGVQVRVIQPPQGLPGNALGQVGSSAWTSQIRVLLTVRLLELFQGGVVNVPLIVDVAPAEAELREISCQGEPGTDATATIRAHTGAVRAQIADITQAQFNDPASSFASAGPATILNVLGIVKVTAWSPPVTVGSGQADMVFTQQDVSAAAVHSVTSGGILGSLLGSLRPQIDVQVLGLGLGLGGLTSSILAVLTPVLSALDPLLDGLLSTLGVRLGQADVRVSGIRCGVTALVN